MSEFDAQISKLNPRFLSFSYLSASKRNNCAGRCRPSIWAASEKFQAWTESKLNKIEEKKNRLSQQAGKTLAERLAAESKKKEAIAEAVRVKNTPPPAEEAPAATEEQAAPAAKNAEGAAEAPAAE